MVEASDGPACFEQPTESGLHVPLMELILSGKLLLAQSLIDTFDRALILLHVPWTNVFAYIFVIPLIRTSRRPQDSTNQIDQNLWPAKKRWETWSDNGASGILRCELVMEGMMPQQGTAGMEFMALRNARWSSWEISSYMSL